METIDGPLTHVGKTQRRLKVLFLPAWYPSREDPEYSPFIREHARAASLYNEVVVLYVYEDDTICPWKRCQTTEEVEDAIRTIRVKCGKYRPIAASLKQLFVRGQRSDSAKGVSSTNGPGLLPSVKALLKIDGVVAGDSLHYWRVFSAHRKLLKSGWRPDVIHAHVFTAGVPAVILGRLYLIPVVITEHWSYIARRLLSLDQRLKIKFAMNRAKVVLPVSKSLQQAIQAYGGSGVFRTVPNTVDTRMFSQGASRGPSTNGQTRRVLSATRFVPEKGVPYLLQAVARVGERRRDFVLDILGDGPDAKECELLAERIGVDDIVRFHGSRPKPVVAQFMRECDFFVQASLVETFGVVYIEAMACGKPVIACDIPGPNEFINQDVGILVPARDVGTLAKAIDFMLDHYADYSAEEIAQYARDRFSHEAVGRMLDEVYREALERATQCK